MWCLELWQCWCCLRQPYQAWQTAHACISKLEMTAELRNTTTGTWHTSPDPNTNYQCMLHMTKCEQESHTVRYVHLTPSRTGINGRDSSTATRTPPPSGDLLSTQLLEYCKLQAKLQQLLGLLSTATYTPTRTRWHGGLQHQQPRAKLRQHTLVLLVLHDRSSLNNMSTTANDYSEPL
jgi:hypothetical protein